MKIMVAAIGARCDARHLNDGLIIREGRAQRLAPIVVQQIEQVLDVGEQGNSGTPEKVGICCSRCRSS